MYHTHTMYASHIHTAGSFLGIFSLKRRRVGEATRLWRSLTPKHIFSVYGWSIPISGGPDSRKEISRELKSLQILCMVKPTWVFWNYLDPSTCRSGVYSGQPQDSGSYHVCGHSPFSGGGYTSLYSKPVAHQPFSTSADSPFLVYVEAPPAQVFLLSHLMEAEAQPSHEPPHENLKRNKNKAQKKKKQSSK